MKEISIIIIITTFFVNLSFAQSLSDFIIITDLDNTYKITKGRTGVGDLKNIFFSEETYEGMPLLYADFKKAGAEIIFLTNQTSAAEKNVHKLLNKDNLVYDDLIFRKSVWHSGSKHKTEAIEDIVKNNPEKKIILLGDNLGDDQTIYAEMMNKFPEQILSGYIRPITDKEISETLIIFNSSLDIRIKETELGRDW